MASGYHAGQHTKFSHQKNICHTQNCAFSPQGLTGPLDLRPSTCVQRESPKPRLTHLLNTKHSCKLAGGGAAALSQYAWHFAHFITENPMSWEVHRPEQTGTIGHCGRCHCQKGEAVGQGILTGCRAGDSTQTELSHPTPSLPLGCPVVGTLPDRALPGDPAELLVTEAAHVRMLRVLHDLFYQPMADGGFFSLEELQNIFPSLDELIEVHCECRAVAPLCAPAPASSLEASATRLGSQHVLVHPSRAASVPALGTTPPQIPRVTL